MEHVETRANPSDVLRRDGFDDPSGAMKVNSGQWTVVEEEIPWSEAMALDKKGNFDL